MGRPRPKPGERRIDAAIDYLVDLGFPKPQIRRVINKLLKLYGKDGWVFLEEGQYRVVLESLLEEQAQPQLDQKQEAAATGKESQENEMQVSQENNMQLLEVQNVAPVQESRPALESQASHNSLPSFEPVPPVLPTGQGAHEKPVRPPCHGWISDESDTESEPEDGEVFFEIPVLTEGLPSKRRRQSKGDVVPNQGYHQKASRMGTP